MFNGCRPCIQKVCTALTDRMELTGEAISSLKLSTPFQSLAQCDCNCTCKGIASQLGNLPSEAACFLIPEVQGHRNLCW